MCRRIVRRGMTPSGINGGLRFANPPYELQTRAGATISFIYDTLNRLSTRTVPSEPTVTYSYDLAGHPLGFADNST